MKKLPENLQTYGLVSTSVNAVNSRDQYSPSQKSNLELDETALGVLTESSSNYETKYVN